MFGHWYIVANQHSARIFTEVKTRSRLKLVKEIENPLGDVERADLISRKAGSSIKSAGRGFTRGTRTKPSDPKDVALDQFAKSVAKELNKDRLDKNFSFLTIVAEPNFLGKLRSEMNSGTQNVVVNWLKKDLYKTPESKLPNLLLSNVQRQQL